MPRRKNARIRYDYARLYEIADELEYYADRLNDEILKKLDEITEEVFREWDGDAADVFYARYLDCHDDMDEMAELLKALAKVLRQVVDQVQEAEKSVASQITNGALG